MEPWYKVVTPRKEVREGRSFNPDEFAIALEQVVAGTAPEDYRDPVKFFSRTCFTRALRDHAGMVLRRLAGKTADTAPVLTLITQFGGGKTHTLTALYHLAQNGNKAASFSGVTELLNAAGLTAVPEAKVAVWVGTAWDPTEGRETPWIDIARQLAGKEGVALLGKDAIESAPGTTTLSKLFEAAGKPVLILADELLNFFNRHRKLAEQSHAFIDNLNRAMTGTAQGAMVISLPRSQVEMTEWDQVWQEKITKVVRRIAKDLIANDETEISEVVRRRLFEDLGGEKLRDNVAKTFADWCFERRAQLPPEWTAVDTAASEKKAREFLQQRFAACYPFHPATLSVFQRKWQTLPQYQQTRGTLAMLAQWISWAQREGYKNARREPLITIGSAPLDLPEFRSVILGQLGEARLVAAIDSDISGQQAHARALDADTKGALRDIHRRVGGAILFESSGGQTDKAAHLPELRFALGEPEVDTTSIDTAALSLESKSFYIRRVGSDGFRIAYQPTLKKVVSDRRASLDDDNDIKPAMRSLTKAEFDKGASIPIVPFPNDGSAIQDSPKLTLVVSSPESGWLGNDLLRKQIAEWTRQRGSSPRLYPGSLVWCIKKPGRDFREKVELWLAWKRVSRDIADGTLGADFDRTERADLQAKVKDAEDAAKEEVWASYRYVVLFDNQAPDGIAAIDLGAGHASGGQTLCGRIIAALKSNTPPLLNESVGAGYIERNWPPALKESGAWPLKSLRQSFLNGSLTRLLDPDTTLRARIIDFVAKGDFGIASGKSPNGTYDRTWFAEPIMADEVAFEDGVFLLTKAAARGPVRTPSSGSTVGGEPTTGVQPTSTMPRPSEPPLPSSIAIAGAETRTFRLAGTLPPELWNRLSHTLLAKLRRGDQLRIGVEFSVTVRRDQGANFEAEIKQALQDLGLEGTIRVE